MTNDIIEARNALIDQLQKALAEAQQERDALQRRIAPLENACKFVRDVESMTFAECSLAEEIVCRCRDALTNNQSGESNGQ